MKFRWRLRPLIAIAAIAITAIGLISTWGLTHRFLEIRLVGLIDESRIDVLLGDFTTAFVVFSAISIFITLIIALVIGARAADALARVRDNAISRARRRDRPVYRPSVAELHQVAAAFERMADEFEGREIALTREREELALLVNSVSEGILLLDEEGRVIHANPAARTLLGLPEKFRGQPLRSFVRSAQVRAIVDRLRPGETGVTAEIPVDDRRVLLVARPLARPNPLGPPDANEPGAVVGLVDLTELRRLEGVRRDFVANVSHELKTPLTSIRGYVETLLGDDLDPVTRNQFLDVIQKNADRLHSIVDDLLDLSRIESGGWRPNLEKAEAARIIRDSWESFADRARQKDIHFEPPANEATVLADPSALRQILSNLYDNALRYTGPGGTIQVRLDEEPAGAGPDNADEKPTGDRVVITVGDTGSGIPSDALPRIFERFYRVDPARSRAEGGTGLGLSIVKHLTESMSGDVSASSELGKGTRVRVRLPAARPAVT